MSLVIARASILTVAGLLVFGGALILWQQINLPSVDHCYTFPAGTMTAFFFLKAYQGGCPFNALPNYYASDIALILLVAGFGTSLVTVQLKDGVENVQVG